MMTHTTRCPAKINQEGSGKDEKPSRFYMEQENTPYTLKQLREELERLDTTPVDIDGKQLRPSQCYRFETDPVHVLFNTNCPESLRAKVESILSKYIGSDESRS